MVGKIEQGNETINLLFCWSVLTFGHEKQLPNWDKQRNNGIKYAYIL
jgi:hypothetical protein